MKNLKIEEVGRDTYYIKGDFRQEIENDNLNGLHLENCEILDYDKDGIGFETNGYNSRVYFTNTIGEIEHVLLDEYCATAQLEEGGSTMIRENKTELSESTKKNLKKRRKAKKYMGSIVKVEDNCLNQFKYVGITRNFKNYKEDIELNVPYSKVTLLKENVTLYKSSWFDARGSLSNLCHIRENILKGNYTYSDFLTKEQLEILLKKGYVVIVQGLQEIELEDLNKLENSNLNINWKFADYSEHLDYLNYMEKYNTNKIPQEWKFYLEDAIC